MIEIEEDTRAVKTCEPKQISEWQWFSLVSEPE